MYNLTVQQTENKQQKYYLSQIVIVFSYPLITTDSIMTLLRLYQQVVVNCHGYYFGDPDQNRNNALIMSITT